METSSTDLGSGLLILLAAQILSAYMGVYVQETYAQHGANWRTLPHATIQSAAFDLSCDPEWLALVAFLEQVKLYSEAR